MSQLTKIFERFKLASRVSSGEMLASAISACIALAIVTWVSKQSLSGTNLPFILASMGATAVILFATPNSAMGRPWPLLAGHFVAAFIGISCGKLSGNLVISVPLTIGLVIFAMHYLRCIHPPGGATALLTLLGGPEVSAAGYQFMLTPLAINLLILALVAFSLNKLRAEKNRYARVEIPRDWQQRRQANTAPRFSHQDLQAAIDSLDSYIDTDVEQLTQLYEMAERQRYSRKLGALSCQQMMERAIIREYGDGLQDAWLQLSQDDQQAIVVVNRAHHVEGILTLSDFIKHAQIFDLDSEQQRVAALIKPNTTLTSDKPEAVGQIMSSTTFCVQQDMAAADAWPMFERYSIEHLPVIDQNNKLVGIINRSTLSPRLNSGD